MSLTIIAEAGVNHDGSLDKAIALVRSAHSSGADVVKFQHFRAETIVAAGATTAVYQAANTGETSQMALLRALEMDIESFAEIARVCREEGIAFLCTAFDMDAAADLVALGMPALKIPSGELTNHPMLAAYARFGLPVWLSTGMADMDEVGAALSVLDAAGARDVTLLHCTSLYPAPPEALNLKAMAAMAARFGRPVGYSDHSLDDHASIAAVALGATLIEKHFTLDRTASGPDHKASLEPGAFAAMARRLRETAAMLGDGVKRPHEAEIDTARLVRRSWHAARDLEAGRIIAEGDVTLKRPATGLAPSQSPLGHRLSRARATDEAIRAEDLA